MGRPRGFVVGRDRGGARPVGVLVREVVMGGAGVTNGGVGGRDGCGGVCKGLLKL